MGRKSKKKLAWAEEQKASPRSNSKASPKASPRSNSKASPKASPATSKALPKDSFASLSSPKAERNAGDSLTVAPSSEMDPRFLGKGISKLIWLEHTDADMDRNGLPRMSRVVVNASDEQLFRKGSGTQEEILMAKIAVQRNEYEFTRMIYEVFPDMIPRVYEIEGDITPQPRFRYYKDRCESFPVDADLFHRMIHMIDRLIEQGWAYLDMKPGNIGLFEGRPVLMDTEPRFFYQIPPQPTAKEDASIRRFYRVSCHMIVVLFCLNHAATIPTQVLKQFMDKNRYTIQTLLKIYRPSPITKKSVEDYNNEKVDRTRYDVLFIRIVEPIILLGHYGVYKQPIPLLDSSKRPVLSPGGTPMTEIITLDPRQRLEQLYKSETE